jgi:hypothetical protein
MSWKPNVQVKSQAVRFLDIFTRANARHYVSMDLRERAYGIEGVGRTISRGKPLRGRTDVRCASIEVGVGKICAGRSV